MGTGSNNPETPQTGASAANSPEALAALPTQITVSGQQFELRNMSAQRAAELYGLLSPADQARVNRLAGFIENFRAPITTELPEALREPGRLEEFVRQLQRGSGRMLDDAPDWAKNLYTQSMNTAGATANSLPGADYVRSIVGVFQGGAQVVGGTANALGEARDWMMMPPRAIAYALTRGREWLSSTGTPPTAEQAMALATGYQGALAASRREAGFFDGAWAYVQQGWDWLQNSPIGTYASALFRGVGSLISGDGFSSGWNAALNEARNNPAPQLSHQDYLDRNLEQPQEAVARFRNAGTIADRDTTVIADTLDEVRTNGSAIYRDYNNTVNRVQPGGQTNQLQHENGAPVTMDELNAGRGHEVFGNIGRHGALTTAAGAAGATYVTWRAAQGIAREGIEGPLRRAEAFRGRAATLAEAGATDDAARLAARAERNAALAAERQTAAAGSRLGFTRAAMESEPGRVGRLLQWTGRQPARLLGSAAESVSDDIVRIRGTLTGISPTLATAGGPSVSTADTAADISRAARSPGTSAASRAAAETVEHTAPRGSRILGALSHMRGGRLAIFGLTAGALGGLFVRGGGGIPQETVESAAAGDHEAMAEQQRIARGNFVGTASGAGVGLVTVRLAQSRFPQLAAPAVQAAAPVAERVVERAAPTVLSRIGSFGLRFLRAVPLIGGAVTTGTMSLSTPPGANADEQGMNGFQILERDREAGRISASHYAAVRSLQVAYCGSGFFGFAGWGAQEVAQNAIAAVDANMINRYFPESMVSTISSAVSEARGGQAPASGAAASAPANFNGAEGEQRFNTQLATLVGEANVNATRNLLQQGGMTSRNALDADRNGQITGEELQAGYEQVIHQAQRSGNNNLARQLAMHVRDVHPGAQIVLADSGATVDPSMIGAAPAPGRPAAAAPAAAPLVFTS